MIKQIAVTEDTFAQLLSLCKLSVQAEQIERQEELEQQKESLLQEFITDELRENGFLAKVNNDADKLFCLFVSTECDELHDIDEDTIVRFDIVKMNQV